MQKSYLMWICQSVALVLCAALVSVAPMGCAKEEAPKEEAPAPPPPPSKDQLKKELLQAFAPIGDNVSLKGGDTDFVLSAANNFKQVATKVSGQRATNPNVEPAMNEAKSAVEDTLKMAQTKQFWLFEKGSILCFKALDPNNKKYDSREKLVDQMLIMPRVRLNGFTTVDQDVYAFFTVFDRKIRKEYSYRVREGEEFHEGNFQFVRIIGNQMAGEVLYKPADHLLTVNGPRMRSTTPGRNETDDAPVAQ